MFCFWGGILKINIHFFFTLATRGRLYHPVCVLKFKLSQERAGIGPDLRKRARLWKTWQLPSGACGWRRVGVGSRRKRMWWSHLKYRSSHINTTRSAGCHRVLSFIVNKKEGTDVAPSMSASTRCWDTCFPCDTASHFKQTTSSGA